MNLGYTRAMVSAVLDGSIERAHFQADPIFGVLFPDAVQGVPSEVLVPRNTWADQAAYEAKAYELAALFERNFAKFGDASEPVRAAGPKGKR
jgi:phosphoenolpyruvate carboxykinase (ATP)